MVATKKSATKAVAKKETSTSVDILSEMWGVQVSLDDVRNMYAPNATPEEFALLVDQCIAHGLDLRKREAHFIKYGNKKGQIVVGYQVYIKRAAESGSLDGWSCETIREGNRIAGAKIAIHRKDWSHPFEWTVDIDEFDTGSPIWREKKDFMIRKVCIGQGFRLAFPSELGGMPYLREEISSLLEEERVIEPVKEPKPALEETVCLPAAEESILAGVEEHVSKAAATPPEPEVIEAEVVEAEPVVEEAPAAEQPAPVVDELTPAQVQQMIDAFSAFDITEDDLNTVFTGCSPLTAEHRTWALEQYAKLTDNSLDREGFIALRFNS